MRYFKHTKNIKLHHSVVSLGKFDGVHLGHRAIFGYMTEQKKKGYQAVAFTFSNHPKQFLEETTMQLLYTEQEKCKKLEELGIDALISYPFSQKTASMEPEEFIETVLIKQLDAKIIVVGNDFCFGHNRRGDVNLLKQFSHKYKYQLVVFEKVSLEGSIVSSSNIREYLKEGNIEKANRFLGKPYSIIEEVVHGRELGRTLGMPTINMIPSKEKLLPPNGVYISKTRIDHKVYGGITNIGYKPTVGAEQKKGIETYIFDFKGDLYGKVLEVELYQYQRGEQRFPSLEELKNQMNQDVMCAKLYWEKNPLEN